MAQNETVIKITADDQASAKIAGIGKKFGALKLPAIAAVAAIAGIGIASIKTAISFESAFAGVRKTVDATEAEFAALKKGIRGMALELPTGRNAIAAVSEAAGQLGIQTENILDFTRTMIDLGETTNLSATEAASAGERPPSRSVRNRVNRNKV